MFIKVKNMQDVEIIINASHIRRITPFAKDDGQEGCYLEFVDGVVQEVKAGLGQLETLTEANSIEKILGQLEIENTRLRQRMQFEELCSILHVDSRLH